MVTTREHVRMPQLQLYVDLDMKMLQPPHRNSPDLGHKLPREEEGDQGAPQIYQEGEGRLNKDYLNPRKGGQQDCQSM